MPLSALQALFDQSEDALAIVKSDHSILDINPSFCRLLGTSREHLLDLPITGVFANESDWLHLSNQRHHDPSLSPWIAVTAVDQSGHRLPVVARAITVEASNHDGDFVIVTLRDVSLAIGETGLPNNSHAHCQDRLLRLTAGLAHDFNNVLAVISGNVQLAHMKSDGLSVEPFLRQAELGCAMAARMIDQLYMISQTRRLYPEVISIPDFLQNRLALFQGGVGSGVRIRLEFSYQSESIRADLVGLENVLLNLVLNASEAMPDGGTIDIVTGKVILEVAKELAGGHIPAGTYLRISVKDTGIGMPQHIRQRAFEPYITTKIPRQLDSRDSSITSGTGCGLGLAQVHGYVMQSGGGVDLDSVVGHGTTLSLYLPMH